MLKERTDEEVVERVAKLWERRQVLNAKRPWLDPIMGVEAATIGERASRLGRLVREGRLVSDSYSGDFKLYRPA